MSDNKLLPIRIGERSMNVSSDCNKFMLTRLADGSFKVDEVATLGDSDVFVRRDASGQLKLIVKTVKLYANKKEIAKMGKGDDDPWIITVPGYNKLNQIAGVYLITPPDILINGLSQSNPYVEYLNGEIKRVIARKIAIGYSPIGNLVAIDTVRHYNFDAYYLQDLQAKAKWKPESAKFGTPFMCPFSPDTPVERKNNTFYAKKENKVYIFKVIKDVEGIWIDPGHGEIMDVYSQHIQHQKFGETIAQNLASRNALKAHPAIASSQVRVVNGVAEVDVYGFRHDMTREQLKEMGEKIVGGQKVDGVDVTRDEDEGSFEEVRSATETEIDETATGDTTGEHTSDPPIFSDSGNIRPEKNQRPAESTWDNIQKIVKAKGLNINEICENLFDRKPDALTSEQAVKLLGVVEKIEPRGKGGKK